MLYKYILTFGFFPWKYVTELFYGMPFQFHKDYSNLITQLPPSIIDEAWKRLTVRKRNPLTEDETSSINPIIESFLKHEIAKYQQKKQR